MSSELGGQKELDEIVANLVSVALKVALTAKMILEQLHKGLANLDLGEHVADRVELVVPRDRRPQHVFGNGGVKELLVLALLRQSLQVSDSFSQLTEWIHDLNSKEIIQFLKSLGKQRYETV